MEGVVGGTEDLLFFEGLLNIAFSILNCGMHVRNIREGDV